MSKFEKFLKYYLLGKSVKEMEIEKINNKIHKNIKLTDRESKFINLYYKTIKQDNRDYMYLSKNSSFNKIVELLENNIKVICNLQDKNGKIGLEILKITNNYENEICNIVLDKNEKYHLHDKYLYNLIYNHKKEYYSLEEQDEYFEKVEQDK
jgi:hypothetical protein